MKAVTQDSVQYYDKFKTFNVTDRQITDG